MKRKKELKQEKIPLPKHAVTWIFPFLVLGYYDGSIMMLSLIFVAPIIALVVLLVGLIMKRLSYERQYRVLLSSLAIALTGISFYLGSIFFSASKMFQSVIVSPIPKTVNILDKSGQLSVMGKSTFSLVFDISNEDFNIVLNSKDFIKKNISNIEGRKPKLYKRAVEESREFLDASEIYVKDDKGSSYRCTVLVTNKEHNKVYYRVF